MSGPRGENDAKWLTKGRLVAIVGRLHHNTWTDTEGTNRERYEVIAASVSYLTAAGTDGRRTGKRTATWRGTLIASSVGLVTAPPHAAVPEERRPA